MRKPWGSDAPLRRLAHDRRGVTAIVTALSTIVVLGFVGLGIDVGAAYTARRSAQGAADSAAYTAAVAQHAGAGDVTAEGQAIAASYGFTPSSKITVAVNAPPLSGRFMADPAAVEVVITRPGVQFFSGLFAAKPSSIRARAVATVQAGEDGDACVLALDPADVWTVTLNGTPNVNLSNCALDDNSANAQAMLMNGSAVLTTTAVNLVGGLTQNGTAKINTAPIANNVHTSGKSTSDPYALKSDPTRIIPTPSAPCHATKAVTVSSGVVSPGTFCGGLSVNASGSVTFNPGVYVIDNGSLTFNGTPTVAGNGVTFVLTGDSAAQVGTVTINGGANVTLTPPPAKSGPTAGMLFWQDPRALTSGVNNLNGGSKQSLAGALYFPSQSVIINGNNIISGQVCTQLIAWKITFNGTPTMSNHCDGLGTNGIGGLKVVLVE
ncbi:MAG: hypothetical protein E7812_07280 [Phenylobacterium sp.]|nr:MAG: hypothetical protein E7812_07280 [Phenylobacterium sp.]